MSDESITFEQGAIGAAFASFLVSINTIAVLKNKGAINDQEVLEIIRRAEAVLKVQNLPGGEESLAAAKKILELAIPLYQAATAQSGPSGAN
jgi:hypothetical protein